MSFRNLMVHHVTANVTPIYVCDTPGCGSTGLGQRMQLSGLSIEKIQSLRPGAACIPVGWSSEGESKHICAVCNLTRS